MNRELKDCPYCPGEFPLEGLGNLWVHCAYAHPDTPLGQMLGERP